MDIVYIEFYLLYLLYIIYTLYILYKLYILNTLSKTVFPLSSNLMYPAIQISDPIDPGREISAMPNYV